MTTLSVRASRAGCVLAVLVAGLAGCGGNGTYPVSGKVVFADGKPLAGGWVVFEPAGDAPGQQTALPSASGEVRKDGSFQLGTYRTGDGALPGRHRVAVRPPTDLRERPGKKPPPIDPRFGKLESSRLEFVVEAKANQFMITVTPPPARKK